MISHGPTGQSVHDARRYFVSHVESVDLLEPAVQLAVERLRNPPAAVIKKSVRGGEYGPTNILTVVFYDRLQNYRAAV